VRREFPNHFQNFVFMNVRTVDAQSYGGSHNLEKMKQQATTALNYFINFCYHHHAGDPTAMTPEQIRALLGRQRAECR
jgi:hypothetical protein